MNKKNVSAIIITIIVLVSMNFIFYSGYSSRLESKLNEKVIEVGQLKEDIVRLEMELSQMEKDNYELLVNQNSNSDADNQSNDLDWLFDMADFDKITIFDANNDIQLDLDYKFGNQMVNSSKVEILGLDSEYVKEHFNFILTRGDQSYSISVIDNSLVRFNDILYKIDSNMNTIAEAFLDQPSILYEIEPTYNIYNADIVRMVVQNIPFYYFDSERSRKVVNGIGRLINDDALVESSSDENEYGDIVEDVTFFNKGKETYLELYNNYLVIKDENSSISYYCIDSEVLRNAISAPFYAD